MNTKERGDLAVGFAISHYISHGYEVCLPIGDKRPYDLIVEKERVLLRIQIKYAGYYPSLRNQCVASLRVMGGNQSYYYARKYENDDLDKLFVHTARGENYEIPWVAIRGQSTLTIEAEKYKKYRV